MNVLQGSDRLHLWDTTRGTEWKKHNKSKGFCSNFVKSFGKVMEGDILWAKSDITELADAGVDTVN